MNARETFSKAVIPALAMLPPAMSSPEARVLMAAIALQESRLIYRHQKNDGPARGLWQFELGTPSSHGGVWGIYLHDATRAHLRAACKAIGVRFDPRAIWQALATHDELAAVCARLLLWTDAAPLPAVGDCRGARDTYLRTWRPGKPRLRTWRDLYAEAVGIGA